MQPLPIIVALAFLAVMLGVGVAAKRFVGSADDFHQGGRNVPWWVAGLSIYMGAFSAFAFVSFGSVVFTDGGVGLLAGYGIVIAYVLTGIFFAKRWHRADLATPVEYLEKRFGPETRQFVAIVTLLANALSSAVRLFAFAMMLNGLLGFPILPTILIGGAVMAIVAISGGLWSIVLADAVQFVILLAGLIPLLVLSVIQLGGFDALITLASSESMSVGRGTKGWEWLATWWMLQAITGCFSLPVIQRLSSVPTEGDAKKAIFLAAALLVPTPFLAMIPVAIAFELLPATPPELAFGAIANLVLPIGMLGLMAGAMIAATVSELETSFNIDSGIVTRDIYQRWFRPDASPEHLLAFARGATLASATVAISIASILAAFQAGIFAFSEAVASRFILTLVIPFIAGILVRRLSQRGFFAVVGFCLAISAALWSQGWAPDAVRLPIVASAILGVFVAVWLLPATGQEKAQIDAFFDRLANPLPASISNGVDAATIKLVGATIVMMSVIPGMLWLAATGGVATGAELWTALSLVLLGSALLFSARHFTKGQT